MMYQSRRRKRVSAIPRGPDGSAFQKCFCCGVSVAIALVDMHVCRPNYNAKKLKADELQNRKVEEQNYEEFGDIIVEKRKCQQFEDTEVKEQNFGEFQGKKDEKQKFQEQPRSAFRFFMEEGTKQLKNAHKINIDRMGLEAWKNEYEILIDRMGFEAWKNMSMEAKRPYICQAEELDYAYAEALRKEEKEIQYIDQEADSRGVRKVNKSYNPWENSESVTYAHCCDNSIFWSENCESLDTKILERFAMGHQCSPKMVDENLE